MQRYISNNGVPRGIKMRSDPNIQSKEIPTFCNSNNIKLFFAPVDDHRAIGVVERIVQTLKRRLAVMRIDKTNTSYRLASDVAEIIKTSRITPHGVTKVSPFEALLGRKPNTPLSNIATNTTPNNLNWENAKHACLDRKNLEKPPLPAEIIHDLQRWSEDEVTVKKRRKLNTQLPKNLQLPKSPIQQTTGARHKVIELAKDQLNVGYKGIQTTIDPHTKK